VSRLAPQRHRRDAADGGDKVKYFEGHADPDQRCHRRPAGAAGVERPHRRALPFGVLQLGPWQLHPLVLVFALSALMISKTLRIPKPERPPWRVVACELPPRMNEMAHDSNDFKRLRASTGTCGATRRAQARRFRRDGPMGGLQGFRDAMDSWTRSVGAGNSGANDVLGHFNRQSHGTGRCSRWRRRLPAEPQRARRRRAGAS
jgi:hypothetical protein